MTLGVTTRHESLDGHSRILLAGILQILSTSWTPRLHGGDDQSGFLDTLLASLVGTIPYPCEFKYELACPCMVGLV